MVDNIYKNTLDQMEKALESLTKEFQGLGFDRANPALLENLKVDVYGQKMPLKSVSSISTIDNKSLSINVWDAGNVSTVDKAIRTSNLNLNPVIEGNKLIINLPPLTTDRKNEIIKLAKAKTENAKISIRNIRRSANEELKKLNKDSSISEDEMNSSLKKIQSLTDENIKKTESYLANKEKSILDF